MNSRRNLKAAESAISQLQNPQQLIKPRHKQSLLECVGMLVGPLLKPKGIAIGVSAVLLAVGGGRHFNRQVSTQASIQASTQQNSTQPTTHSSIRSAADSQADINSDNTSTESAKSVTLHTAELSMVESAITLTGTVVPESLLKVTPSVSGLKIVELRFQPGDRVAAGDVLAVLDNRILRSQLAQAEARMAQAQSDLQQKTAVLNQAEVLEQAAATEVSRYATLYAQGAISQEQLGQRQVNTLSAQQNVAAARAALDSAHAIIASQMADISRVQAQLDQAVVVAPTAGTIAERLTTLGNTATVDTPIYSLIEDSQLMLAVTPSQAQLRQIEVGSTVAISTTDTNNPLQLRGEVDTIEPTIDANSRQALVKISLPEEAVSETGNRLHSGMFLRAQLVTGRRRSVVVPATAVIAQPDGTAVVYTVSDRADSPTTVSANWVTVASRPAGDNTVEVVAGLEPGSRVVVGGASYLQPGDTVTTVPQAASATDL
ncbi:MAG: efflux RND transporter periplasmic adaptor subunit [Cyanobacteria bacterium J06560_6]